MKRLLMAAVRLVGRPDRVVDAGISAEDLVSQVLEEFYDSPNGCGWDGSELGLTRLLCRMVQRRFIDHVRRDAKVARDSDTPLATAICKALGPEQQVAANQLEHRLLNAVRGHKKEQELRDFIQASQMLENGSMVDKQLAHILDVDESEVRNRRKMLRRMTNIEELGGLLRRQSA